MNTLLFASELFSDRQELLAEIPIALTGSWVKDGHRFSITKEDLDDIVKNFQKRGNGQVVVDFEHASERPEVARGGPVPAAGWIHSLSVKDGEDGKAVLWADVEFTQDAEDLIKSKRYKFFSPAIDWGAVDKKTGRSKGATITSGAVTNHPFLEELPSIQLSEKAGRILDKQVQITYEEVEPMQFHDRKEREITDDEEDSFHVDGGRMDRGGRPEAERRAKEIDDPGDGGETDVMEARDSTRLPRLGLRKMSTGHHAVVNPKDGKIHGFVSHGDLMAHAERHRETSTKSAATEVMHRTKKLMEMPGNETMSYRQAHSAVLMSDTVLAERYRREQTKLVP